MAYQDHSWQNIAALNNFIWSVFDSYNRRTGVIQNRKGKKNDKCIMKLMWIPLKIGLIGYVIQTFYSLHLHIQYILHKVIKEMSHKDPLLICVAVVKHQSFISIWGGFAFSMVCCKLWRSNCSSPGLDSILTWCGLDPVSGKWINLISQAYSV